MLYRKMLRDFMQNKTQFIAIFLMAFLAAFVFVGLDCEASGCQAGIDRYYTQTNLFDVKLSGAAFTQRDIERLKKLEDVLDAELRTTTDGYIELETEFEAELNFIETNQISSMKIVDGEAYTPGADGIWLDYLFLEKNMLSVGDHIRIKIGTKTFTERIRGSFMNPEYVYYLPDESAMYPDYGAYAFAFLSGQEYPDDSFYYTQILVDLKGVDNTGDLSSEEKAYIRRMKEEISQTLDYENLVITDKEQSVSYGTYLAELSQHKSMAFAFPVIFMLIAVLGIITTMTRMTSNQRTQIGTLKALGFSRISIIFHYVSYGVVLSLVGSIAGSVTGYFTIAEYILYEMSQSYLNPYAQKVISYRALFVITASVLVCALVSYAACRKVLSENAAAILRPEAPVLPKHTALEKSKFWRELDFSTQWNLRDVWRNKVRSLMGVFGVAGCTMLLVCAFGCNDSMDYIFDWMYGNLITGNYKIVFESDASYGAVYDISRKYEGQMIQETAVEISNGTQSKTGTVTVVDDGNYYHFQDAKLNTQVLTQNGIAISYKMAQLLDVSIGDVITWNIIGDKDSYQSRIVQIFRTPSSQGIAMSRDTFEKLGETFSPTAVYTNKSVSNSTKEQKYVSAVQSIEEQQESLRSMTQMMNVMVAILIAAAVMLGMIVLYNMGVLSFVEKIREMSTLKVLGFQSGMIQNILQKQNIWITAAGCALGIPLGKAILVMIFSDMGESMDYMAVIYPASYLYSVIGAFAVSILVNYFLSRKVRTIDMVDALKGVE
jgi:putative ABC transport system permease protein